MIYGIQKDGELTQITKNIYAQEFNLKIGKFKKQLVIKSNKYTLVWTRNKSLIPLLLSGAINYAVVGTDHLIEQEAENKVKIMKKYKKIQWPLYLAATNKNTVINTVATQYPKLAGKYLKNTKIIPTFGGTEAYPYLAINGQKIDAILDMSITGKSFQENKLIKIKKICSVYPVLVTNL